MKLQGEAELLRIFIGESDRADGRPLYERIVEEARMLGVAGATVVRGLLGYGASSRIHSAKILRLSEDLPLVIEIVDRPEKLAALLDRLDSLISNGMVTRERVEVVTYRSSMAPPPP